MKNLKKLLALVVACVMVFGMVASAAVVDFPDVAVTAKYAEAVKVLSALNIINGDDKGNFNPDQNVTRAEMAKILCAMMSKNSSFGQAESGFADVTAAHWASGYVKYAKGLGYINGYDATTFGPEDNVTYEQAIKLIVAALGRTYEADENGGYPAGYMMVAADNKITDKVAITDATAPAKRSDIALLVFNALTVKMMKRTGFGTEAKYEIVADTLLKTKLGVDKYEGKQVTATYVEDTNLEVGEIKVDGVLTLCDDPTAPDYLGYADVTVYETENEDGDDVVIAITAKANKITEYVFEDLDVLADGADGLGATEAMTIAADGTGLFTYWTSEEHDDKKPTVLDIENGAVVYVNGEAASFTAGNVIPAIGTIKAYDTNGNDELDLFKVTKYDIAVIDSVVAKSLRVRFKAHDLAAYVNTTGETSVVLNEDVCEYLTDIKVTIDGEAATIADLQENDVAYICTNDYNSANMTFIEFIVSRKTAEGKAMSAVTADNTITIGADEYDVFPSFAISISDEGKYFLTADGMIVGKDITVATSDKFAYVYKVGTSAFDEKSVRMLTAEGEDVTYDVADRIEINGVKATVPAGTAVTAKSAYTAANLEAIFGAGNDTAAEIFKPAFITAKAVSDANICAETIIDAIANDGLLVGAARENKLIAYELSGNAIAKLFLNKYAQYAAVAEASLTWKNGKFIDAYNEATMIAAGAKIFMIPAASADIAEWKVVDSSALVAERDYPVAFFGYNDKTAEYAVALVAQGSGNYDTNAAFAYFKSAVETVYGEDDEKAYKVTFIQGGEEKVAYVMDDNADTTLVEAVDGDLTSDFALGTVFLYSTEDDANVIDEVEVVYAPITSDIKTAVLAKSYNFKADLTAFVTANSTDYMFTLDSANTDNEVYFGVIGAVASAEGGLGVTLATAAGKIKASSFNYVVGEDANVVVLDYTKRSIDKKLYVGTEDSIQPSECVIKAGAFDYDNAVAADVVFEYALVRVLNDKVVDVLVINFENTDL
jgi:hypothetical protein